jgi:hypothetical protein
LERDLTQLCNGLTGVSSIGVSGMTDTELVYGRRFGGTAILYRNDMNCRVRPVECQNKIGCACVSIYGRMVFKFFLSMHIYLTKNPLMHVLSKSFVTL